LQRHTVKLQPPGEKRVGLWEEGKEIGGGRKGKKTGEKWWGEIKQRGRGTGRKEHGVGEHKWGEQKGVWGGRRRHKMENHCWKVDTMEKKGDCPLWVRLCFQWGGRKKREKGVQGESRMPGERVEKGIWKRYTVRGENYVFVGKKVGEKKKTSLRGVNGKNEKRWITGTGTVKEIK